MQGKPHPDKIISAAATNDVKELATLIDNGADVETVRLEMWTEWTPLIKAAESGHVEAVDYLITRKANVNHTRTEDGYSALIAAASKGYKNVCESLLKAGASKTTAAAEAAKAGHKALATFIEQWAQVS